MWHKEGRSFDTSLLILIARVVEATITEEQTFQCSKSSRGKGFGTHIRCAIACFYYVLCSQLPQADKCGSVSLLERFVNHYVVKQELVVVVSKNFQLIKEGNIFVKNRRRDSRKMARVLLWVGIILLGSYLQSLVASYYSSRNPWRNSYYYLLGS